MSTLTANNNKPEYLELSEESRLEQLKYAETLRLLEAKQRARTVIVPTAIEDVKAKLRELGQPITLYGEDHADRRERLKEVVANLEINRDETNKLSGSSNKSMQPMDVAASRPTTQKDILYSEAKEGLIEFRKRLSNLSFERAHQRLLSTKRIREDDNLQGEENAQALRLYERNKDLVLNLSQYGDDRPLSIIRYHTQGAIFASGALSPLVKLWNSITLQNVKILRGHTDRVTGLAWQKSDVGTSGLLATSSADGTCLLWDCSEFVNDSSVNLGGEDAMAVEEKEHSNKAAVIKQKLRGHNGIVSSCDFHPYLNVVGTACHDLSWRLWDIETAQELLLQDGHVKECTSIVFHPDGSLVFTADGGGVGLLWDLRSGQMIQGFQGHIKRINHSSFHPNGFQVATSSIDNTVKIWDLRKKKCHYTLPAHSNVISDVRFSKSGELLLTSSFDGSLKIWNSRDYNIIRTLSGHNGKVMSCDFSPDESHIVSAGFDRTVKLWAHKAEF